MGRIVYPDWYVDSIAMWIRTFILIGMWIRSYVVLFLSGTWSHLQYSIPDRDAVSPAAVLTVTWSQLQNS